ncbi:putative Chase2 sensor protein [Nostoc commune NIES-4072]|uniref:Putative Chase2 sensor protein n=1 Tax=Nostoc commune NIES-4072 TaxID=2005467 RepID=A0A2R5FJM4_NOSCO|nr:CHASE2 domain-containing protein [Nostoc commune]BBD63739.1 putative Chase2 sensor protein [Nostoc commune HK-02]GBG18940.1 putative Chase2 sensor protein [Nostoc commune NIES-4072]
MTAAKSNFEYQIGGSLESNAPSYVKRYADTEFYERLKWGQFCYVLNSRQMGKSSLRVQMMQRLQAEGIICAFIDLTGIGTQDVTPEKWYAGIVQSLVSSCQLHSKIQWRSWWRERRDLLSPVQCLSKFIEEVLLVEIKQKIVIFIDEIDRVLSQNFSLDDFFALIRFFFQQREVNYEYRRLTFALLGVANPNELIQDKTHTPFNIGKAIELQGFQPDEVQPLIDGLKQRVSNPEEVIMEILEWTGGQPFLTQKLCQLIVLESTAQRFSSVEQLVRSHIVENWESQDEPEHLKTIRDRILYRNEKRIARLLELYQQILRQGEISADSTPEQIELRLSGLVVEQQGKLKVYNRIYKAVFNQSWVERKLTELRPYAEAIAAWSASAYQDQSYLLRGQALQDTLAWALGKSLGDLDYQFLAASQELAKRQAQISLQALAQANKLLAQARQKAKLEVLQRRIGLFWIPRIAIFVTAPILLLRFGGLLQGGEWNMLDQFFCWRLLLESPEKRIAIVTIDEEDIQKAGKWPIPDQVLAKAIANIKAQKPRAIGLDIYRDLPVEPGYKDLVNIFKSTPNLYGIEKVVGSEIKVIAPPPTLNPERVGFADQVVDADGKVRRALLSVDVWQNETRYSLAMKLAQHYLNDEKITIKLVDNDPQRQKLRWGKAVFERFLGNDGGYVHADSGGYQILLNFRGNQENFATFPLRNILEKRIPPDSLRDRLVLIGTNAASIKDVFYTPYNSGLFNSSQPMTGVSVHANIISQIISAVVDGRPLLHVWQEPIEWLWILVWAGLGVLVSRQLRSSIAIAASIIFAGAGLLGIGFLAFCLGWWLPIIPSLLVFLGSAVALELVTHKQLERLQFHHTLALLFEMCQDHPLASAIAIEYLKQSESQDNQAFIEQQLREKQLGTSTTEAVE